MGLNLANVNIVANVYFICPLGQEILLANLLTKASKPVLNTCTYQRLPKSPVINPKSIALGS